MSKREKFSVEEKIFAINQVLQAKVSRNAKAKRARDKKLDKIF